MKSVKEEDRHRSRCERYNVERRGRGWRERVKEEKRRKQRWRKSPPFLRLQFDLFKSTKTTFQSWKHERKSGMMEVRERKEKTGRSLDLGHLLFKEQEDRQMKVKG